MRILMWFTIGFSVSCGIGAAFWEAGWLLSAGICVLLLLAGLIGRRWREEFRVLLAVSAGCAAGLAFFTLYNSLELTHVRQLHGQECMVSITASDFSYDTDYGCAVDGHLEQNGKRFQTRIYLDEDSNISPGDEITGIFRFRITTREGIDSYHPGKGIFLLAYQSGELIMHKPSVIPLRYFPALLRHRIEQIMSDCFPEDVIPFIKALLLGLSYDLSYETETALKISGIRHIVAVSGLHISVLYGLIQILAARRRLLTVLLGIPALFLFAAVAGFSPSVCRACVMVGIMMIAQLLNREYDAPTALALAVIVMLLRNPLVITSAGLQLSVASVSGILMFQAPFYGWFKAHMPKKKTAMSRIYTGLATSVCVTFSAMSLTVPLSVFYFRTVSLVSFLTNFLTLWLVEIAFIGILIVCVVSFLSLPMASLLGWLLAWPVRGILATAHIFSRFPLAAVYTESIYILIWIIFSYCVIAVFLVTGRKHPGKLLGTIVLGLCISLSFSWAEPMIHNCRMTVLDVGQGQCILLQSEGKTFLVDCGGDHADSAADLAMETLYAQGINRVDGVIVTHYDADHFAGIPLLLTRVETDLLILPATEDKGKKSLIPEISGETVFLKEDTEITFGNSSLKIYGPVYSGYSNENSLCVLFDTEKCDILITGDRSAFGERMLLRRTQLQDVDILVAGHHGAKDSASDALLKAVSPETVMISVGADNIYGHPHGDLLERLVRFGCSIYRTDINGTIVFRR